MKKYLKNRKVKIIYGKYKGKISKIKSYKKREKKIYIYNINLIKKHIKPNKINTKGKKVFKEMPIDISNICIL